MTGTTTPAGWYPDPGNPAQQRYWDGVAWTEATAPAAPGYGPSGYAAPGYGAPGYGAPGYGAPGYGTTPLGYGYTQALGAPLAGFWTRFAAYLIDGIIFGIPANILSAMLFDPLAPGEVMSGGQILFNLLVFVVGIIYYAYLEGSTGQTVGKKAMSIRVVDADTLQPGIGTARGLGRYFSRFLSVIPCLLGYFWMLWDDQNQTWHDKLPRTKVIKVPA